MYHSEKLMIFTRFPIPGESKTRLIPALGAEGAAALQRQMTEHTVRQARKAGVPIEIRLTGGTEEQMRDWLGDDLQYAEQGDGDLGERMARAFQEHFDAGAERVVIIGSDCPSNHWKNIRKSFQCLEKSDCVIGPAADGGYYLIGFHQDLSIRLRRRRRPTCESQRMGRASLSERAGFKIPVKMFQNIEWGTENVLKQTLAAAPCKPTLLSELDDVDLPEDIPPKISVIIPTLNEEKTLFQTLEKVNEGFNVECMIADGGSTDLTHGVADQKFSHFMKCEKGRGRQMNSGAAAASGEILLFLHADTELPDHWDFLIRAALKNPQVALGAFRFQVKERLRGIGWVEWATNLRSKFFRMPYGDQGLFVRKKIFDAAKGFPDMPIMEDYAFVRRVRRFGKVITLSEPAITSGRRWQQHGVLTVTAINRLMVLGYLIGVPPRILARLYRRA